MILGNVQKFGKSEFLNFIKTLGGFPMIEGDAWKAEKFNRSQLFVDFPTLMFDFFNLEFEVVKRDMHSNVSYVYVSLHCTTKLDEVHGIFSGERELLA